MNDCTRLSDRMPEVALGRAGWTAEEAAHLAECDECGDEWRLMLAARSLTTRTPAVSDPVAMAAGIQSRIVAEREGKTRARRAWSFIGATAAAAAIAAVILTGRPEGPAPAQRVVADGGALVPLPELEGLETAELDTLLQTIDRPSDEPSSLDATTMGEHEDGELEQVFATWEG